MYGVKQLDFPSAINQINYDVVCLLSGVVWSDNVVYRALDWCYEMLIDWQRFCEPCQTKNCILYVYASISLVWQGMFSLFIKFYFIFVIPLADKLSVEDCFVTLWGAKWGDIICFLIVCCWTFYIFCYYYQ